MEAGQLFGERCLNLNSSHNETATSLRESKIVAITKASMLLALRNEQKLSEFFLNCMLVRSQRVAG
jgi:CRP-like cAMP-binding protein